MAKANRIIALCLCLGMASCEVPNQRRVDPLLDKCSDLAHNCAVCTTTKEDSCPECKTYDDFCKNRLRD